MRPLERCVLAIISSTKLSTGRQERNRSVVTGKSGSVNHWNWKDIPREGDRIISFNGVEPHAALRDSAGGLCRSISRNWRKWEGRGRKLPTDALGAKFLTITNLYPWTVCITQKAGPDHAYL